MDTSFVRCNETFDGQAMKRGMLARGISAARKLPFVASAPGWLCRRPAYLIAMQNGEQAASFAGAGSGGGGGERGQVVAKVISASGLCSRRDAVRRIQAGRVQVNGTVVAEPGRRVSADDVVAVDGRVVEATSTTVVVKLHKPREVLTTHSCDPAGRRTILELLPGHWQQLRCVGRLDYMTEGLLLLTNNGALKRFLELPANAIVREYRVRLRAAPALITPAALADLGAGVIVNGVRYGPIAASFCDPDAVAGDRSGGRRHCWVSVRLKEGKNREIRKVMQHKGWQVTRLIRVAYGPVLLGASSAGHVSPCSPEQITALLCLMADDREGAS